MRQPISLEVPATSENFDEQRYLSANPDVVTAIASGGMTSARHHFDAYGRFEHRMLRIGSDQIASARSEKLARLAPFLRKDMPSALREGRPDYLTDELRAATHIIETENVSSNGYDPDLLSLIARHSDGFILDCGAGRRSEYHSNIVNFEIVAYDTTDVIGVGEALPFANDTFDLIISIAVLEHVRDPFRCAAEIIRVLKPGGRLFCSVPFLAPLHGYPHHYFNATKQGIARLFEDDLHVDHVYVPGVGHPGFALHWILSSWAAGLAGEPLAAFRNLNVGEFLDAGPSGVPHQSFGQLPAKTMDELASSFVLLATKPDHDQDLAKK